MSDNKKLTEEEMKEAAGGFHPSDGSNDGDRRLAAFDLASATGGVVTPSEVPDDDDRRLDAGDLSQASGGTGTASHAPDVDARRTPDQGSSAL